MRTVRVLIASASKLNPDCGRGEHGQAKDEGSRAPSTDVLAVGPERMQAFQRQP